MVWELWSEGALPYFVVKSDEQLIERVAARNGLRLARPEGCPEAVYAVMLRCWEPLPANRPSFLELQGLLMQTLVALGASAALQMQAAKAAAGAEAAALRR